jgi:DHA1 family bicyclomycin/chloramphenicol resistance-like MFS transporter
MILPTIPVLAREFGVSAGGAAQIVTAFGAGKFCGTIVAGVLLDRAGTRLALVGGPLLAGVAAVSVVIAPWFFLILLLASIMGAADSLWATAREFAGIELTDRSQRGRMISGLHGVHTMGAAFSPYAGGWLTENFGFEAAFFGYGVATALSAPLGLSGPNPQRIYEHKIPDAPVEQTQGLAARVRAIRDL